MENTMIFADFAQVISAIAVVAAVVVAVRQYRLNIRTTRARIVADFLNTYHADADMLDAFYALEYGTFKYNAHFAGSAGERQLDKLLGHFNGLARWWKIGILKFDDLQVVDYQLCLIMQSPEVGTYFRILKGFAKEQNRDFSFRFLVELWDERNKRRV